MRLVCPKCVAQYEVAEQEIPEEGREVQCANCEHIWFQDRIVMFTEKRETADAPEENSADEIFDDLDGVSDVAFQHHHDTAEEPDTDQELPPTETDTAAPVEDDDEAENILADDFDEEPEYDDDPSMDRPEGSALLNDDVLDVLRKEAEFSSNRGDPEPSAEVEVEVEVEVEETHAIEEPLETDLDELTAFLSSQELDETDADTDVETHDIEADEPQEAEAGTDQVFDPLSDLDAIRSQLDSIRENPDANDELDAAIEVSFEAADTPREDEFTSSSETPDLNSTTELPSPEATPEAPVEFDLDAFSQSLGSPAAEEVEVEVEVEEIIQETSEAIAFDDFEESLPRQAFRADRIEDTIPDTPAAEEPFFVETDEPELPVETPDEGRNEPDAPIKSAIPAAVALGSLRPRASKTARPVRQITDPHDLRTEPPVPPATEPVEDPATLLSRPERPHRAEPSKRPAPKEVKSPSSRKELLPDVEELDSTLRGEAATVQAAQDSDDTSPVSSTKGFGRAFIWTLFIFAILVALYVMRPVIIAALPVSGVVLNPYANFIDSMRLMIENLMQ